MNFCDRHKVNNCIECAIEWQTEELKRAIDQIAAAPRELKPTGWKMIVCSIKAWWRGQ